MAHTVKKLAELSGVSVRTLHFYDEIGLLPPAYVGENGYRYYEEAQLQQLQQILFFRELGFPLERIQELLSRSDFDRMETLRSHRRELEQRIETTHQLIRTIDKTIARLNGEDTMKPKEYYQGFDKTKQAEYEKYLIDRFGKDGEAHIKESKSRVRNWTKDDWERAGQQFNELLPKLVEHLQKGDDPALPTVQSLIQLHHQWILKFWTPNRESYAGLGRMYCEHLDFRKHFDPYHPKLAEYLAAAMEVYSRTL